jgi:hypothetical protein
LNVFVNPAGSRGAVETAPKPSGTRLGELAAEAAADAHPPASEMPVAAAPPTKARRESPCRASCDDDSGPMPSGVDSGAELMSSPFQRPDRRWFGDATKPARLVCPSPPCGSLVSSLVLRRADSISCIVIRPSAWSVWLPDRTASTEPDLGGLQGDPIGRSFDSAQLSGSPLFREGSWLPTGLVTASAESYAIVDSIED